jgi:hypothetical protein
MEQLFDGENPDYSQAFIRATLFGHKHVQVMSLTAAFRQLEEIGYSQQETAIMYV